MDVSRVGRSLGAAAVVLVAGAGVSACGGGGSATPADRVTVTASPSATAASSAGALSLRGVCDSFEWFPNPPASDSVKPWSAVYDELSVVVLYADPTARTAVEPMRAVADRATTKDLPPDDRASYTAYKTAYDGFVEQCRAAGSTALS